MTTQSKLSWGMSKWLEGKGGIRGLVGFHPDLFFHWFAAPLNAGKTSTESGLWDWGVCQAQFGGEYWLACAGKVYRNSVRWVFL